MNLKLYVNKIGFFSNNCYHTVIFEIWQVELSMGILAKFTKNDVDRYKNIIFPAE